MKEALDLHLTNLWMYKRLDLTKVNSYETSTTQMVHVKLLWLIFSLFLFHMYQQNKRRSHEVKAMHAPTNV